jgi:hypothetical protein
LSRAREWGLVNHRRGAEPILEDGRNEEYRRLLELYCGVDRGLALRLANRPLAHADPEVQAMGREFLGELESVEE